jgi:hypothetical protein
MRRCVEKLLLVLLIVIEKRSQKITAAPITTRNPNAEWPKGRQVPDIFR